MGRSARQRPNVLIVGVTESDVSASELSADFTLSFASPDKPVWSSQEAVAADAVLLDATSIAYPERSERVEKILTGILDREPRAKIVTLVERSDHATEAVARAAGAWDVPSHGDRCSLGARLRAAAACRSLERETSPDPWSSEGARQMVGTSAPMRSVFALIRQVAATEVPVLISGESGTGKELAALAIHERSQRSQGPFVPINCAAIPETLLESELFGHERGAFTGADRTTRGTLEAANGGTLFLDEIGELAPRLQAKLLRFLEDHVVERVGARGKRLPVDVRVIAATNCELSEAVEAGEFRADLYYRLAVFPILMPPLRDREEDVLLMAQIFLRRYAREARREILGFSSDAIDALWKSQWPGNVRELINRVRRAVVVSEGALVTAVDLGFAVAPVEAPLLPLKETLAQAELDCVRRALERSAGNRCQAARILGISRSTLYELLHRHQL